MRLELTASDKTKCCEQLQTTAISERSNFGLNSGGSGWIGPTENNVAHIFGAMTAADFLGNYSGSLLRSWRKEIINPAKEQAGKRSGNERIESSDENP